MILKQAWPARFAGLVLTATIVASCAPATTSGGTGPGASGTPLPERGNVNVRVTSPFGKTFDPQLDDGAHGTVQLAWTGYDRLIALDSSGRIVPYLATSWTQTPNSVTFTIRKGATCEDGTPVTPTVVANSFKRLVSPEIVKASPVVAWGRYYLGPGPYTITADDAAGTFTFADQNPYTELLVGFLWPQTGIICPAGFAANADFENHSYGSGPFINESRSAEKVVVRRRPDWSWGPSGRTNAYPGVPDTLTFIPLTNETTVANLLTTGGLDLGKLQGPDVARLLADKSLTSTSAYSAIANNVSFNEGAGHATSDDQVRKAIMTAIDPSAFDKAAYDGRGKPATSLFMPQTRCYEDESKLLPSPPGDVNKARSLLLADGYTAGANGKLQKDGKPLTLSIIGDQSQNAGPEYISAQLDKMGATVSLRVLAQGTSTPEVVAGNFDVVTSPSGFPTPTPGLRPQQWDGGKPTVGSGQFRTTDQTLIDYMNQGYNTLDCEPWIQWQRRLITQSHALPLPALEWLYFGRGLEPVTIFGNHLDPTSIRRKL